MNIKIMEATTALAKELEAIWKNQDTLNKRCVEIRKEIRANGFGDLLDNMAAPLLFQHTPTQGPAITHAITHATTHTKATTFGSHNPRPVKIVGAKCYSKFLGAAYKGTAKRLGLGFMEDGGVWLTEANRQEVCAEYKRFTNNNKQKKGQL
tara:strand:+ start:2648 stop:3100 length:453 start_codon:yes stop_codon:yes gene_type:complete